LLLRKADDFHAQPIRLGAIAQLRLSLIMSQGLI